MSVQLILFSAVRERFANYGPMPLTTNPLLAVTQVRERFAKYDADDSGELRIEERREGLRHLETGWPHEACKSATTQLYATQPIAPSLTWDGIEALDHMGPVMVDGGVNFAIYSERAERVETPRGFWSMEQSNF